MAEAPRLAAALQYQQGLDDITRPATVNPMMARQVAKSRELMTAPTSIMDERYPAWKKAQENADLFLLGADVAGLTPVAAKGAVAAAKFAAPKIAQGLEQHMVRSGMMLPIDVYHGTPHKFAPTAKNPLGEFNATKIGSGEGAQAYGYGHYLAEAPDVAKGYAKNLANRDMKNQGRLNAHANAQRLANIAGDPKYAIDDIKFVMEQNPDHPQKELLQETLSFLESGKFKNPLSNQGNLYKVDLPDEAVARMLDYDKPIKNQPEILQAIRARLPEDMLKSFDKNVESGISGANAYKNWLWGGGKTDASKAETLRQMGIPGIQYLDAGSRGTSAGKGTRNFVVFPGNEGLLNILGRE